VVWAKPLDLQPILLERPLVSEKRRYGGTIDYFGFRNTALSHIDFKTSKALYLEHELQVAAYTMLLEENGYQVDETYILRIGRDEGEGFEDRKIDRLPKLQELFWRCLQVYRLKKELGG